MKKIFVLLTLLFFACSDDDGNAPIEEMEPPTLNISVISSASTNNGMFELDIQTNGGEISTYNLSELINVPLDANRAYTRNIWATWYKRTGDVMEVWQRNLENSSSAEIGSLCTLTGEFPLFVDNSLDRLFVVTQFQTSQETSSRVHIFNGSGACIVQTIDGFRIRTVFEYGDTLLVYCNSNSVNNVQKIVKIDMATGDVVDELSLPQSAKIAVQDNILHVFFINEDYNTYNADNFNFISNATIQFNYDEIQFGFINTEFEGNTLYTKVTYAQPGLIPNGPALFDFITGEIVTPYNLLYDINNNLNLVSESFYNPTGTYDVDLVKDIVVVGYTDGATDHGIVVSNFDAEILEIIPLDYFPTEITIR